MVYGRLDVFWPDGNFESFLLENASVSVGRADGNTIMLNTETISRYHFSIVNQDGVISITDLDSENGTFVDGMRLTSNEARILEGVEEIQVGHLRLIYQPMDDSPTLPVAPYDGDETQRIEREDADFRLDVDITHLKVWPAASSSTELSITNTSDEYCVYEVNLKGLSEKWVRINRPELEIGPGETAYVLVNFKPPRHPDVMPMPYRVALQVNPVDNPSVMLEAYVDVLIEAYSGFGMALATPQVESGEPLRFYVHNQGSAPLGINVRGKQKTPQPPLSISLPTAPLTLNPGQRMQIKGSVTGKRPLTGAPQRVPFIIEVKAQTEAGFLAATEGKVILNPFLPLWSVISIGGIIVSFLVIFLLATSGVLAPPAEPVISQLQVNATQFFPDETIEVSWQAQEVREITVYVDDEAVTTLEADATSVSIPAGDYIGTVTLRVEGRNRANTDDAQQDIYISPMSLEYFEVEPTELVRYVIDDLDIRWSVPGASETRLDGLDTFANSLQTSTYSATETLEGIGGMAEEPVTIRLTASDSVGMTLESSITLTLTDPTCTATQDISLREGPHERHRLVSTLPAGETVVVTAQDAGDGWLQIILPGEVVVWGKNDLFTCDDSFDLADLRIVLEVPPVPTLTPTFTPTPTETVPAPTATPGS